MDTIHVLHAKPGLRLSHAAVFQIPIMLLSVSVT